MNKPNGGIAVNDEIVFAPQYDSFGVCICDTETESEIADDIVIPDYLPEIRRLLRVTPSFPEASEYIGGRSAEFSGNINWDVLYVGNDGQLANTHAASHYEVAVPFPADADYDINGETPASHTVTAESVNSKVTSPRKLNVRCRLHHRVNVCGTGSARAEVRGNGSEAGLKRLDKTVPSLMQIKGTGDPVSSEAMLDIPEGSSVVSVRASAIISSCTPTPDGATCCGCTRFTVLLRDGNGKPSTAELQTDFETDVALDLDGDGWSVCGFACIDRVSSEDDGSAAVCRADLRVTCYAAKNVPTQITSDVFSVTQECKPTVKTLSIPNLILCANTEALHDGSLTPDGIPSGTPAVDCTCEARPEGIRLDGGHYLLDIKCRYDVIFDVEGEYIRREAEQTLSADLGVGNDAPDRYLIRLCVISCRAKNEGENVALSAEIGIMAEVFGTADHLSVTCIDMGEQLPARRTTWTVAYAAGTDTLWDVAKRYNVDPAELAAANGISYTRPDDANSLDGISFLMI